MCADKVNRMDTISYWSMIYFVVCGLTMLCEHIGLQFLDCILNWADIT